MWPKEGEIWCHSQGERQESAKLRLPVRIRWAPFNLSTMISHEDS